MLALSKMVEKASATQGDFSSAGQRQKVPQATVLFDVYQILYTLCDVLVYGVAS